MIVQGFSPARRYPQIKLVFFMAGVLAMIMSSFLLVIFTTSNVVEARHYRLSEAPTETWADADVASDVYVRIAPSEHEKWMAIQPSMEKVYKLSKQRLSHRRREFTPKARTNYKTEFLFVLSDHNESPMFLDDDRETIAVPNGMNISIVFDTLDEALDYVNNNDTDPESVRFVIVMEHGEHKIEGREARIARPYTSITSTMPKYPEKTVIRANDISGQLFFLDGTHDIDIRGVTLTGGRLAAANFTHPHVPRPCGSGLLISNSRNVYVESVILEHNKAAIGGSACIYASAQVTFHKVFIRSSMAFIRNLQLTDSMNHLQFSLASNFNINQSIFAQNLPALNDPEKEYGCGGGVSLFDSNDTVFSSCIFTNNSAINGGAIFTSNSDFNITNSRISGNTAYNQSSAIYSDLNSDITIDKVYFLENRCVRLSCKVIYSPKKELLDDLDNFRAYIYPMICMTGILLCVVLFSISCFELGRMFKQRYHFRNVVWGDIIYLWLLGAIGVYRPYRSVPRPFNWFHRTVVIFVLVLGCILQTMQSIVVAMPEFYDSMDRVRFILGGVQSVIYSALPLVLYIALILAVKASYKRLFVNYKPPIPTEIEMEEEKTSLINFYQTQIDKESEENIINASPTSEATTSFRKKKQKHFFDWKKDTQKTGLQRSIHNRRALAGCIISLLFLHGTYGIIIVDCYNFLQSNMDIAKATNQTIGLDTISSAIFYLMQWYLKFTIMSMVLLTVFLLCNRINSYQNTFFSTLYHQLEKTVFNLQTGVYSYVHLRKECKRLVRYSWILTITYVLLFLAMCVNEVLMILWGSSEYKFFAYYVAVLTIMMFLITHVSYTSNHWTSFRFDDFLAAVPHSITYDYGIFFVPGANKKFNISDADPSTTENGNGNNNTHKQNSGIASLDHGTFPTSSESKDSKAEKLLRDLTFFHMYIRDRTFAYRFPLEIQMQTYVVVSVIGLIGTAYALLKYVSSIFESSRYYQYL
ncbi:hypothetical protein C9374_000983 [Naegleria lovaniensis]|uniref:Right handed beta helix domain-containing protein n=1 Tax=Naegleria lovaniensis TaxID=51637 RepID=A0AA88KN23_NAELO|nr:uncharacterized protein C9374_000983 [Naegleria lovaniensis]KAG2388133.1 hypothetical protein C9374_000983 [Naegleria lovaniensis]